MLIKKIQQELKKSGNKEKARILQRFFKTGPGEYAEGDIFLGITVPVTRSIAKKYKDSDFKTITALLHSPIHEERLLALLILIQQFHQSNEQKQNKIYHLYLKNTKHINNWDLVDLSAYKIIGSYLFKKNKQILVQLAKSKNLWERRISIISTYFFIKNKSYATTLEISKLLLDDKEDLIHKAVGWMLREIGKKDLKKEEKFLKQYYKNMPRTMLRYAIEKFPEDKRQNYLKGNI